MVVLSTDVFREVSGIVLELKPIFLAWSRLLFEGVLTLFVSVTTLCCKLCMFVDNFDTISMRAASLLRFFIPVDALWDPGTVELLCSDSLHLPPLRLCVLSWLFRFLPLSWFLRILTIAILLEKLGNLKFLALISTHKQVVVQFSNIFVDHRVMVSLDAVFN